MQGFINSISDENLRKEDKYKSIFTCKFTVVTVTPRRDFALQYHCSASWISYCTHVHAHCTIQHCFYKL